jgi:hypothetical protein
MRRIARRPRCPLRFALMVAVQLLFLAFIVATHRDYGVSWDEYFYLDTARLYLAHFFEMEWIGESARVAQHLKTHGVLLDALYFLPLEALGRSASYESLHLVKALFSSLVVLLVYRMLCRIEPASLVPVAGMLMLIFFPSWLGQIFDDHTDGAATLLYALQMSIALPMLDSPALLAGPPRGAVLRAVGFAVVAAIAFSHRVPLLCVPAACFAILLAWSTTRDRLLRWLLLAASFAAVFCAALWVFDPYVRIHGVHGVFERLYYAANAEIVSRLRVLFDGAVQEAAALPASYAIRFMLMTIPVPTLLLLGAGLARLATWLSRSAAAPRRARAAFLLLTLCGPLVAALATRAVLFDGWRHLLFLSVPIVLVASVGLGWAAERLPSRVRPALAAAFLLAQIPVARAMARLHPYEYVYFNALVGGLPGAAGRFETDYWAKSYKEAAEWLRSRVEADPALTWSVHACGPEWSAAYYFPANLELADDPASADYVVCFTRAGGSYAAPRRPPDHTIEREGVVLTRIWRASPPVPLRPPP